jgi:hypothetical protein
MAYNLSDLVSAVQDDLKDPSFSSKSITRFLNFGQNLVFNTHMFKFCEKLVSGALTIGQYAYDQQADHQATIGGVLVDETNDNVQILNNDNYLPHREFYDRFPDPSTQTAGMPAFWTEFGNELIFNCPAAKAYTFRQRYFRTPTPLTTDASVPDVPEAFREMLEEYALFRAEKYRGNHDIAATYKQDFDDSLENMVLRFAEGQQNGPVVIPSARTWISE